MDLRAEIDDAVEQLVEQQESVARKHLTCAPRMDEPGACLVARTIGRGQTIHSYRTLPDLALRALAWVIG